MSPRQTGRPSPTAAPHFLRQHQRELQRWQRLHVAVRCALYPQQAALIRVYLGVGQRLVGMGVLGDLVGHQQMLRALLQTAADSALPWFWRNACLEHVDRPVAQLTSLLRLHDPQGIQALQEAVFCARQNMPLRPTPTLTPC